MDINIGIALHKDTSMCVVLAARVVMETKRSCMVSKRWYERKIVRSFDSVCRGLEGATASLDISGEHRR
jgi:hypothetical protein